MRVCYVAADVSILGITGGSTHTFEVAQNLVRLGHEVFLLCRRDHGQSKCKSRDGLHIYRIYRGIVVPTRHMLSERVGGGERISLKQKLYHAYLHSVFFIYSGLVAAKIIKRFNVDVILERGTSFGEGGLASIITHRPLALEVIGPHYSALSFKRARKILTFSKEALTKIPTEKVEVVSAGVDTHLFNPNTDCSKVRAEYRLNHYPVVGYVGTFAPWHGIQDLIFAMRKVVRHLPNAKLMLVGPYPKTVAQLINQLNLKESVILTGPVSYGSVPQHLAACSVLVAPYSARQWGRFYSYVKIYEYMAMGKPLITTDVIPDAKIIQEEDAGLLIPPDDPHRLCEAILKLLSNERLAHKLAQNARRVAVDHSWLRYAEKLDSFLREAVQR